MRPLATTTAPRWPRPRRPPPPTVRAAPARPPAAARRAVAGSTPVPEGAPGATDQEVPWAYMASDASWLKDHIRDIPDFPRPGVVFKDITPLLGDVEAFRFTIDALTGHFEGRTIDKVLGIEA